MIDVVETWCRKHASGFTVPQTGPRDNAADATLNAEAAARFWVKQGEHRWQAACAIERARGVAVFPNEVGGLPAVPAANRSRRQ